jgi:hypothetical protein
MAILDRGCSGAILFRVNIPIYCTVEDAVLIYDQCFFQSSIDNEIYLFKNIFTITPTPPTLPTSSHLPEAE